MPRVLANAGRILRRGGRLVRDAANCLQRCCGGTGPLCCDNRQGVPPFHDCGQLASPRSGCVQSVTTDSTSEQSLTSTTQVNGVITVVTGNADDYILYLQETNQLLPPAQCFPHGNVPASYGFTNTLNESSTGTATVRNNGANYGLSPGGSCAFSVQVPIVEAYETAQSSSGQSTSGCGAAPVPFSDSRDDAGATERCIEVGFQCWPLSSQVPLDPFEPPPFTMLPTVPAGFTPSLTLGTRSSTNTQTNPIPGGSETIEVSVFESASINWAGSNTQWQETYAATREVREVRTSSVVNVTDEVITYRRDSQPVNQTLILRRTVTATNSSTDISNATGTVSIVANMGWAFNCDGTPGPSPCSPAVSNCQPTKLAFIRGEPCDGYNGTPPLFVLPAANVRACAYVLFNGWCYRFDPAGVRIYDPVSAGATVGSDVTTATDPKTCCECFAPVSTPSGPCPSRRIRAPFGWEGGQIIRDADGNMTGFEITPAFASGTCCCAPGDRFQLVDLVQVNVTSFHPGGEWREWVEARVTPPAFPTGDAGIQDFRRDAPVVRYGVKYQLYFREQPGGPPVLVQDLPTITASNRLEGGVACEWLGFPSGYTFAVPHRLEEMPIIAIPQARTPRDLGATGFDGAWGCVYYNVGVTCDIMIADAQWSQYADPWPLPARQETGRLVSRVTWRILRDLANPCVQGCQPTGPIPLPVPGGGGPDIAGRSVGCSNCGGGGL